MMINNMCVMTNNLFTVMSFMMFLVTLSYESFFTMFNVGGINNGLTFCSGNLSLMLLRNLVTFVVNMILAVRSRGVTLMTSLSLAISLRMMINNMGIMTNNLRTVVNLSVFFLAMCCHNFLTFLNVGGVNNDIIFFMTHFSVSLLRFLMTLFVWLAEALKVVMGSIFMFFMMVSWLSSSLVISMRMMINNMCVMTNNLFTVMSFMMFLVTLSYEFF